MSRARIIASIGRIPWWKRRLICWVFRRREWRVARAYNTITAHAFNVLGDFKLYEEMQRRGDRAWCAVYRR